MGVAAVGERAPAAARLASDEAVRAVRLQWTALLCFSVALSALAVWIVSPRFAIDTPSLIDDWSAISRSPDQAAALVRLENPERQRFRPSWILWNEVQWHTFDAPRGLVGPNAWNLARLFVVLAGLCLLSALAMPAPRTRSEALRQAALAATPALMLLAIPKFSRDLARFGVQEPLLLGGLALGGSLLVLAIRGLVATPRSSAWLVASLGVVGGALWLAGAYHKEASLSAVPLLAAVLFAGRAGLRAAWPTLGRGRRAALAAIGAVFVLPLVHVGIQTVRIAGRGDLVYDAQVDSGRGIVDGAGVLYDWAHEVFSLQAQRVLLASLVLAAITAIVRRRVDAIALGVLAAGAGTLVFAAQTNVAVSRYYLPAYALAAVALVLSLARLPAVAQVAGLVLLLAVVHTSLASARDEVQVWVDEEDVGAALVALTADLDATGCPVAVAGVDLETTEALPVLVALQHRPRSQTCERRQTFFVARQWMPEGAALVRACATPPEQLQSSELATVFRCSRLGRKPVRDPELGLVKPARLVALRRLPDE